MGMGPRLNDVAQLWRGPLFVGDLFILTTDGVSELLTPSELLDHWWASGGQPQACAERVLAEVEEQNGADDASLVVVDVLSLESNRHG
jgi:serine/threonine protein phosphatase PrpC